MPQLVAQMTPIQRVSMMQEINEREKELLLELH